MNKWDFPEALLRLQDEPHVIRRRTEEEEALAAISEELQRQYAAIQAILGAPAVRAAIEKEERLERYRQEGFDWSGVAAGRFFWRIVDADGSRIKYRIGDIEFRGESVPHRIRAYTYSGSTMCEVIFSSEAFAASFGGWVEEAGADG